MKLEHCDEHDNCTIVDGTHTARRPALIPEGMAKQEAVDALAKSTSDRLIKLENGLATGLSDADEKANLGVENLRKRVDQLGRTLDSLLDAFNVFKGDTENTMDQEQAERNAVPDRVKALFERSDSIDQKLSEVGDTLSKLDQAIKQEATDREAAIRQVVEL